MKVWLKLLVAAVIVFAMPSAARASIGGNAIPKYNYAQIYATTSTVDLIPSTNGSGNVWGIRCIFPNTYFGPSVDVKFTVDGGTVRTINLDPAYFDQDVNSRYLSGWIPMNIAFSTSIRVQLSNVGHGTSTIDCWASWGTN
jgi:hypothetical protein